LKWPGDGTAYRIKINAQGNRAAFQAAFAALKAKLKSDDLLFIHTNNHGDNFGSGSFLCEYPNWALTWRAISARIWRRCQNIGRWS
jgi:hypothetical protein